jgi:hypothetical protein
MLEQSDDPLLSSNYFNGLLRFVTTKPPITLYISREFQVLNDQIITSAKYYPFIFDFLRRRIEKGKSAPLHVCELSSEDGLDLNTLEDFIFPDFCLNGGLPHGPYDTRYVALPPPQDLHNEEFTASRKSPFAAEMCADPEFVRLVIEGKKTRDDTFWRQVHVVKIMRKYDMDIADIMLSTLVEVSSCEKVAFISRRRENQWTLQMLPPSQHTCII